MKEFFRPAKTDKIINKTFLASAAVIVIIFLYVIFRFFSLPPYVPVFNQLPWGNDRIGPKLFIFIPLLIAILIQILNLPLASYIYTRSPLLSRILAVTSLLCTFLILIFSVVIINLII